MQPYKIFHFQKLGYTASKVRIGKKGGADCPDILELGEKSHTKTPHQHLPPKKHYSSIGSWA